MAHTQERSTRRSAWSRHLIALAFFVVLLGVIYGPVVFGHASLKTDTDWPTGPLFVIDPSAGGYISLPLERLGIQAWLHLQLPFIDPYQAFGIPLLASQGVPVFLPELIVHLLLSSNYSIWNILRLLVLGFGTYLLATSFGQSLIAGIGAGVGVSLAGVVPPNINLEMLNPLMVLPWVLLSLRYLLDPAKPRKYVYALGFATGVFFLATSGFQEALPLLAVVILIFGIAMIIHFGTLTDRLRVWLTLGAGVFGVLIGSIGLLPTLSAVSAGMGENGPLKYLGSVPPFWLATLSLPHISGPGLVAQPTDLGQAVWVLGTPVLGLVIVLAVFGVLRHRSASLWYVGPSLFLVAFGILGYANLLGVLDVFGFFPFDSINMLRVLGFVWWLPWCLLLGFVISVAKSFKLYEIIVSLLVATAFDLALYAHFEAALRNAHQADGLGIARHALYLASAALVVFALGIWSAKAIGSGALAALVFVVVTVLLLPTNFFPSQAGISLNRLQGSAIPQSDTLTFDPGEWQLPTDVNSVQVFGPILPRPYSKIVAALIPASLTTTGLNGVNVGQPTLFGATVTAHLVTILGTLGVNEIASTQAFAPAGLGPIPRCSTESPAGVGDDGLCFMGRGSFVGGSRSDSNFLYKLVGVDPILDPEAHGGSVPNNTVGLDRVLQGIHNDGGVLPSMVYLTGTHGVPRLARGVVGVSREATTESVTVRARARTGGLVVMRDTYLAGMHCRVNGRSERCYPVDGGLWTAVHIPAGTSVTTLGYVGLGVRVEFVIGVIGIMVLALGWLGVLFVSGRDRFGSHADSLVP
ncbi:hypothetical protein [Ferrimicrobium sp.]|uniref:hypothetical protein n=1 Tax=Ferrimicrobium sp. TaxID=2926050 RepID=UPI00262F4683|nr:hypothetical protein [Ferrimicrobium sp.]